MNTWTFAAASALALTTAACHPKVERAVARLDCPTSQGSLSRVSAAPDGKSCFYTSKDGAEVQLRLIPVTGGVPSTLAALEKEAMALRDAPPAAEAATTGAPADAAAAEAQATADAAPVEEEAEESAGDGKPHLSATIDVDDGPDHDDVNIHMPGVHIETSGDSAKVKVAGMQIDAGEAGATIRKAWDVRLRGEATAKEKRGMRALFIHAADDDDPLPSVGYQAAGPKAGPITAALVKWSARDNEEIYDDVRKLVRKNGGA